MTFDEKNQIIILKDTSYDDILAIVDFMYRGEINVGQVNCFAFFCFFTIKICIMYQTKVTLVVEFQRNKTMDLNKNFGPKSTTTVA